MWQHRALVGAICVFSIAMIFVDTAQLQGVQRGVANHTKRGVCTLEVPTIDLLTPEDRRNGVPHGNGSRNGYSKIDICCSGYERLPHTHLQCVPVCDGCENGNCTSPGVCECKRGYILEEGSCIPTCPIGCLNGVCTNRGQCSCNAGNELSRNGKYCLPHCTGGCGLGGKCVGPEVCACEQGFSLDPRSNKCGYHCEGGCGQGTCIAPNQCSCSPGYKIVGHTCVPDCPRGCQNGECTAPNKCSCKPGWTLDNAGSVCTPHCSQVCLNGDCIAPETCACKKGYTEAPGAIRSQKCVAHCPGGCTNGICSAPNFCICNPGYVKESKGSNVCVRRFKRSLMHLDLVPEAILNGH
ncbi:unnamed protein product [Phaedon cochleariae]|uniref:EGF-like domain-containing protein n=1 Tax=Phaedon cochleariae TaxID=80249 RepID=A0A9P0GSV2_PHACE|nr:unnamed protein product [Phaedon cochleariae]